MSEEKSLVKTFDISYKSKVDGKFYTGLFEVRKMTIGQQIKKGILKARLAEGNGHDYITGRGVQLHIENMIDMVAHLEIALVRKPEWCKDLLNFVDPAVLEEIYGEAAAFEASFLPFRPNGSDEGDRDRGDNGGKGSDREGQDGGSVESPEGLDVVHREMVDGQVPFVSEVG